MRLGTVLLLAASGMRATEALSIRLRDIDWKAKRITISAEFTKTRTQRYILLTEECFNQLKKWKEHRERERRIVALGGKKVYAVKRIFKPDDLILTTGHFKTACDPTVFVC